MTEEMRAGSSCRIGREKRTIAAMLRIYCTAQHGGGPDLCGDCKQLRAYAHKRLENCPFQEFKPACNHCRVHCYSKVMRDKVKGVMRHSGPRMLWKHPLLSFWHLLDTFVKAQSIRSK
jgi:hypothetical protein